MARVNRATLSRHWLLVCLAGIFLAASAGTTEVRAAGCHVADRPVLSTSLTWKNDSIRDLLAEPHAAPPPRVLTHLPCRGELPLGSSLAERFSPAAWHQGLNFDLVADLPADFLSHPVPLGPPQTRHARLDRPPRRRRV